MNKRICRTAGRIAEELGVPIHRVQYILRTRKHISPIGWAGAIRIFGPEATAKVKSEIDAIEARRREAEVHAIHISHHLGESR